MDVGLGAGGLDLWDRELDVGVGMEGRLGVVGAEEQGEGGEGRAKVGLETEGGWTSDGKADRR